MSERGTEYDLTHLPEEEKKILAEAGIEVPLEKERELLFNIT